MDEDSHQVMEANPRSVSATSAALSGKISRGGDQFQLHFPALRRLLDVRNSIQSLEEDPTLEDAVEAVEAETSAAAARTSLSPGSATAMASLLSSPLLFPLTPHSSGPPPHQGGQPTDGKDMSASIAALLLPSPSAVSLSGIVPSNTCAVCGVTFRMTSDLVYHMRTHHAKNAADSR